jgi:hypothetical protein
MSVYVYLKSTGPCTSVDAVSNNFYNNRKKTTIRIADIKQINLNKIKLIHIFFIKITILTYESITTDF